MEEIVEVIGVEHLKTVLSTLTPEDLAYNFEKKEQANYNMWESKILNKYYDAIREDHNPFQFSQSSL